MLEDEKLAFQIPYPKEEQDLPIVLSRKELSKLFYNCENIKHKLMLTTLYSSGLRRNELLNLRIENVETNDGKFRVRINRSKGNKDRYTVLSKRLLPELRAYYKLPSFIHGNRTWNIIHICIALFHQEELIQITNGSPRQQKAIIFLI